MIRISNPAKQQVVTALIMVMLSSLFISRVALSVSTILFCTFSIIAYCKEYSFSKLYRQSVVLAITCVFFLALLTGIYSTNSAEWWSRTVVKIPLLLLPIVFIVIRLSSTSIFFIQNLFILLVTGATVYTMSMYYLYTDDLLQGYQQAKVLPTLLDGDHIRSSWCVVIACILVLAQHTEIRSKKLKLINLFIGIWLFVFLHILMSKTGLLLAYGAIFIYVFLKFIQSKNKKLLMLIPVLLVTPWISYHVFPTFKKRVDYILYDYANYSKGMYKEGLSDGVRVVSIEAGLHIIKESPVIGVGYGDVETATNNYYDANYSLKPYEKILPSSQLVLVGAATGLLGLLFFTASLLLPIFKKETWKNIFYCMFYFPAVITFLFEIHLESQYGVFIFAFFTCWFAKFCRPTHS